MAAAGDDAGHSLQCRPLPPACPAWLQAALADIEERVRSLSLRLPENADAAVGHSFAERAEDYYLKRPELIALLRDLRDRYLQLADRYCQSLHRSSHCRSVSVADSESSVASSTISCADSVASYLQQPFAASGNSDAEAVVAELVAAWVQRDIAESVAAESAQRRAESARKIDLQASLLEVLESERLVLLGENARLAYRAEAAVAEASAASAEVSYMRSRAAEMARLVVRLHEDHRACVLGRRIEALQAQLYEVLAAWEAERKAALAEAERLRNENRRLLATPMTPVPASAARKWRWWERVWKVEWMSPCVPAAAASKGKVGCFCL